MSVSQLASLRSALASTTQQLVSTEQRMIDSSLSLQDSLLQRRSAPRQLAAAHHFLVLGVVSNQRTPETRQWIRKTYMADAVGLEGVLLRFVIGKRGLTPSDRKRVRAEKRQFGDLEMIAASDFAERGGIFSCIDKLFEWFPHAVRTFPGAAFYAKADDDSLVDVSKLVGMLRPLTPLRNVYSGYVQYDSFITDEWKHCGWGANPVAASYRGGCPAGRSEGPFPFVVGALTIMGGDLAATFEASAYVKDFVARGRASQTEKFHWDCGYSDVTLGYVRRAPRTPRGTPRTPRRTAARAAPLGSSTEADGSLLAATSAVCCCAAFGSSETVVSSERAKSTLPDARALSRSSRSLPPPTAASACCGATRLHVPLGSKAYEIVVEVSTRSSPSRRSAAESGPST